MDLTAKQKAEKWLNGNYDEATKAEIRAMMQNNLLELENAFYKDLEFGTGGMRGIMGVGTNKMNKYTVGTAAQGLANYLKKQFPNELIKAVVAHDCRNNSRFFAETTANVLAANGIKVFLFEDLRPTPELSFSIRQLKAHTGVVITASHNPKEYNGFKAYWSDGGQLVPPHDKGVIQEVYAIQSIDEVKFSGGEHLIELIGEELDVQYIEMLKSLSLSPEAIKAQENLKIVFTPIHGTAVSLGVRVLQAYGFKNINVVEEQMKVDGNFPTVIYPNPEESEALTMALQKAKSIDADILLGTDPDADRVGIAVKNHKGEWQLLNGNQTAALLFNYVISVRKAKGRATPQDFICKTIVTTDLIDKFAAKHGIRCFNVLTGFKYIAEMIRENEGKLNFVCGGEESYGYLIGDAVRDKDAIGALAMICEMAAYAKNQGKSLFDYLLDLYIEYGFYKEGLISLTKKGKSGAEEIKQMMIDLRKNPPKIINGSQVIKIMDYQTQISKDLVTGKEEAIHLPKSDVLQFFTADGSKISARPSGTEPKIKFYFSVVEPLSSKEEYEKVSALLDKKIEAIISDMKLS
ncbi:MAG: phospho-sugar mutase [Cytophagales bacterium]|nr:phospho-sugar mutase [Cytophagales bacterium]MDW8384368.1 phospho-sugar mutase [Flammeovirgaceae bacterium]